MGILCELWRIFWVLEGLEGFWRVLEGFGGFFGDSSLFLGFWKVSGGSIEDFLGIFEESDGFLVF